MTHERDHQTIANLVANICVSIYSVQLSQMGLCVKYTLSYLMQHTVWSKLLGKIWHGSRNAWTGPTCPNFSLQTVWNWKVSVQSVGNSFTDQKDVVQPLIQFYVSFQSGNIFGIWDVVFRTVCREFCYWPKGVVQPIQYPASYLVMVYLAYGMM